MTTEPKACREREAFRRRMKSLAISTEEDADAWGRMKFKHSHVEAAWSGFQAGAAWQSTHQPTEPPENLSGLAGLAEAVKALPGYRLDGLGYKSMAGSAYVRLDDVIAAIRHTSGKGTPMVRLVNADVLLDGIHRIADGCADIDRAELIALIEHQAAVPSGAGEDADITEMQNHWYRLWRNKRRWIIVEEGDGTFSIHEHMIDGVAPPTVKPSKREVAARLLQLLGIGPVAPQDYPEEVCVGTIEYESADIIAFAKDFTPPALKRQPAKDEGTVDREAIYKVLKAEMFTDGQANLAYHALNDAGYLRTPQQPAPLDLPPPLTGEQRWELANAMALAYYLKTETIFGIGQTANHYAMLDVLALIESRYKLVKKR